MVKMAIFVGVGRTDECSNNKKEEKKWKLLSKIKLTANNPRILIRQDAEGNEFSCEKIIIVGKIVSNITSKPMCKINDTMEFSGVNSTYVSGTRYIYETYEDKGFFIERDAKYLTQDILESSVLFDNGFFRVVKGQANGIKSIELYGDSTSFVFKAGTELEIYGF
jgi:hypothetical protein